METLPNIINGLTYHPFGAMLGWAFWQSQSSRPAWLTWAFLISLILSMILYLIIINPPRPPIGQALGILLVLGAGLATTALFFVLLFNLNPFPYVRSAAEFIGLGQLVNFDTAFADGLPDAVSANIGVISVERADTDADSFDEWVVFYQFDKRARNSPIHGAVYDNDRGNPPVIFPYQLQAPDRNYLSEQQPFGPSLTVQELATDRNGLNGADVPELIVQGGNELTIFRFQENSEPWNFPTDSPARYQAIGFFRGSGGVSINLNQASSTYGRVTVIDRNGYERSQLAVRSVYGLVTGSDGNQTYLDPIPPLGGVGGPQVAAPILSTVDFNPTPPDELFNTPFPEKIVLGFYAATCGGTADDTLCSSDNMNASLLWRPEAGTSLGSFLAGDALGAFNSGNPNYFSLPAFNGNSNILVAQLCYFPQLETDPDLLESGGGRDVVTGEQGQVGMVDIVFAVNGSARQTARYELGLQAGKWKILRRLQAPQTVCSAPTASVNQPPIAVATVNPANTTAASGQAVPVEFSGLNSSDPDGDTLTYAWSFEDGSTASGPVVGKSYVASDIPQTHTGMLTVTDGKEKNQSVVSATINPDVPPKIPPTANPNGPYQGLVCQEIELFGTGSTDPDGGNIVDYRWDFGDGATINTSGITTTHTYTTPGSYTASLVVTDDDSQTSHPPATTTVTISLPPPPAPPSCGPPPCCW